MPEEILASVQVRRDSKANWESANPILLNGEAAYEQDTDMFKIGDGVKRYSDLPYHNKVGPKGDTGATPQISMSVSTGAAGSEASVSVSGTAENPLISLTIPRGDTGASGSAGADGVSPTVSTSKSGKVTTITFIDATGTKTATINDGADGEKGDTGDTGPAGANGYTPVRGTDYWTAADQEQIISDVLAALPNAQGVSF